MNLLKSKPSSGELFDASATAVRKLEHLASTLGVMVDLIRGLTVRPLTAAQREIAIEAFKSLDGLDPMGEAARGSLARLHMVARDIENSNRRGD